MRQQPRIGERSGTRPVVLASSFVPASSFVLACAFVLAGAAGHPAAAQALPDSARPSVAPEALSPGTTTPAGAAIELAPAPASDAPAGAKGITFTLAGLAIDGVTAYPADTFEPLYRDRLNGTVSLADIFALAQAVEARYRGDGFVLTRVVVPAQRIADGRVRLQVVEGRVAEVTVQGDAGAVQNLIETMLAPVNAGSGPTRLATIERALLLVNDLPGISARGTLSPLGGEAGASRLLVEVKRKPFDGFAAMDNRASRFTGRLSATAGAGMNAFTGLGERLDLIVYSTLFNDEQRLVQMDGQAALSPDGLTLEGLVAYGRGEPGFTLAPADIETESLRASIGLRYPVLRGRRLSLWGTVAFESYDERDEAANVKFADDSIRTLRAGAEAEFYDGLGGVTTIAVSGHLGLPILGATEKRDSLVSRDAGSGRFAKITAELTRHQHFLTLDDVSLDGLVTVAGQWASRALLADQEFRLGGYRFGRGYAPGELSGDDGVGLSSELQLNTSVAPGEGTTLPLQLYGFFDAGQVWNRDPGSQDDHLSSTGGGVRVFFEQIARAELELAKPLNHDRADLKGDQRDPQIFVRLVGQF